MTSPTPPKEPSKGEARKRFKPERARLTGFIVVLDTCSFLRPTLCDVLLCAAEYALFRPIWTKETLDQVSDRLVDRFGIAPERAAYVINQHQSMFPEAEIAGYETLIPVMTNDDVHRPLLAAAVLAKAQVIVTARPERFPRNSCANYNIEALSPDDFLCDLLDVDYDRMLVVLSTLSTRRTLPAKTIDQLLAALESSGCPMFAAAAREEIARVYGPT